MQDKFEDFDKIQNELFLTTMGIEKKILEQITGALSINKSN